MSEDTRTITVLQADKGRRATKLWASLEEPPLSYDAGQYFKLKELPVASLQEFHSHLKRLVGRPRVFLIRGELDPFAPMPGAPEKLVRRLGQCFLDTPSRLVVDDIDSFPMLPDETYAAAAERFIREHRPEYAGASYILQLSASCGHPSKAGTLRAHLWLWSSVPLSSNQLRWWAGAKKAAGAPVDMSVYGRVQPLYIANPVMGKGIEDPLAGQRLVFVQGSRETVDLEIPEMPSRGRGSAAGEVGEILTDEQVEHLGSALAHLAEEAKDYSTWIRFGMALKRHGGQGFGLWSDWSQNDPNYDQVVAEDRWEGFHPNEGAGITFKSIFKAATDKGWTNPRTVAASADFEDLGPLPEGGKQGAAKAAATPRAKYLCTEQANADRIANHFNGKLRRFASGWYVWTGTHWQESTEGARQVAMNLSRLIAEEERQWRNKPSKSADEQKLNVEIADSLHKWGKASESAKVIDASLKLAAAKTWGEAGTLDSDPYLLNVKNGTIDLRTGKLRSHSPDDFITRCINLEYDPGATCPEWERALGMMMLEDKQEEQPVTEFLQRWVGYCATGCTHEHKLAFYYGGGSNGKSTLLEVIRRVLGPYAGMLPVSSLSVSKHDRHPTEIAKLKGLRCVLAQEPEDRMTLNEGLVKRLTGGDGLTARRMREDFFDFEPTHKLNIPTNYKPTIRGQDHGIWRRIMLIEFKAVFGTELNTFEQGCDALTTHIKDPTLKERLEEGKEQQQGILTWIVKGAVDWFNHGLRPPAAVLESSEAYRAEQDRVGRFIKDNCEIGPEHTVKLADLYEAYCRWMNEENLLPLSRPKFCDRVRRVVPAIVVDERKEKRLDGPGRVQVAYYKGLNLDGNL